MQSPRVQKTVLLRGGDHVTLQHQDGGTAVDMVCGGKASGSGKAVPRQGADVNGIGEERMVTSMTEARRADEISCSGRIGGQWPRSHQEKANGKR